MVEVFTGQVAIFFFQGVQARRIHPSQTRQAETLDGTGSLSGADPEFTLFLSLFGAVSTFYLHLGVRLVLGVALW